MNSPTGKPNKTASQSDRAGLVPIEQLVDLESLSDGGRAPSVNRIREALPPGWVLQPGGREARRDLRVLARDGWVLLTGLVCFGAAVIGLFSYSLPKGGEGLWTLLMIIVTLIVSAGWVGPMITKALMRR